MGKRLVPVRRYDDSLIQCRTMIMLAHKNPACDPDDEECLPYIYPETATVARNLASGEIALNSAFKIAFADEGFLKTVGFSIDELMGKDLSVLLPPSMNERSHRKEIGSRFGEVKDDDYYVLFISANQLPTPPTLDRVDETRRYRSFLSYSRDSSSGFASRIVSFLVERGYDIWFDVNVIDLGQDFVRELEKGIIRSDRFFFFLTETWMQSPYCAAELDAALRYNKPILPIIQTDSVGIWDDFAKKYPGCRDLNYLLFRPGIDDPRSSFKALTQFLDKDQDYYRRCTDYLVRANAWEHSGRPASSMLNGPEARLAAFWMDSFAHRQTGLASISKRYIRDSNAIYVRRQRVVPMALGVLSLVFLLATLAFGGLFYRQERILRQSKRDQTAALIDGHRGDSLLAITIAEVQGCRAIETAVEALFEAEQTLNEYFGEFGSSDDLADKSFNDELIQKVNYTRANLSIVLGDAVQTGINANIFEVSLSELSRRYQAGRCETNYSPLLSQEHIAEILGRANE